MTWAGTPKEVAVAAEAVFSIVTDGAAVRSVALGADGVIAGISPESVYLDMSTIDPEVSRSISTEFEAAGLTMLDAPSSGSPVTLAQGSASTMVGGDRITKNGSEIADTEDLEALTGGIASILGHVAGLLLSSGERFRAGEVVIAGSVVPPIPIRMGDEVTFELVPLPPISVTV